MTRRERLIAECKARARKRHHATGVRAGKKAWRKMSKRQKWVAFKNLAAGRAILAANRVDRNA